MRVATLSWCGLALTLVSGWAMSGDGWSAEPDVRREIHFPNLPGYEMLACDFHTHTVFSDGNVWPTVRVGEAWRQGLHVLAISDHIEYQPHKDDVPTNHARPYQIAQGTAKACGLLLIQAAEITRDTPPGHFNALFLKDVGPLDTPEFLDAHKAASQQQAFVFWNHQGWKGEEKGAWLDVHTTLFENKWLHGMEVANGNEYYPSAHTWCLERNLTMLGNSDIHDPDLRRTSSSSDHRTMTLVFVTEPTPDGVHEALRAGRTIVWYLDKLIGREELLRPFFERCVQFDKPTVRSKTNVTVPVRNDCQADVQLQMAGEAEPTLLPARSTRMLRLPVTDAAKPLTLAFTVNNFLVAPDQGLAGSVTIPND